MRCKTETYLAIGTEETLGKLERDSLYAVVAIDMKIPGIDSVNLLKQISAASASTTRIILTGDSDQPTAHKVKANLVSTPRKKTPRL